MKITPKGYLAAVAALAVTFGFVEIGSYETSKAKADTTSLCTSTTTTIVSGLVQVVCVQPTPTPAPSTSPTPTPTPTPVPTPTSGSGVAIELKSFISELPGQSSGVPSRGFTAGCRSPICTPVDTTHSTIAANGNAIAVGTYVDVKGFTYPGSGTLIYAYSVALGATPFSGSDLPDACGPGIPGENEPVTGSCPAGTPAPSPTPTVNPSATPTPTAAPTATPTPPGISLQTYLKSNQIPSANASGHIFEGGSSATPNPSDSIEYSLIAKYVYMADEGTANTIKRMRTAGIAYVGGYYDVHNPCPQRFGHPFDCSPDANPNATGSPMPEAYFEHGHTTGTGRILVTGTGGINDYNQSTTTSGYATHTCSNNPDDGSTAITYTATNAKNDCSVNPVVLLPSPLNSPIASFVSRQPNDIRYRAALESQSSTVLSFINGAIVAFDNQYKTGTGDSTTMVTASFNDDTWDPGDNASYPNYYTWVVNPYALYLNDGSGSDDTRPYTDYTHSTWIAGSSAVINGETHPVLANLSGYTPDGPGTTTRSGINAPAPPSSANACLSVANCLGVMQETMFNNPFQSQNQPTVGLTWASNMNIEVLAQNDGKKLVDFEHSYLTEPAALTAAITSTGTKTVGVSDMSGMAVGGVLSVAGGTTDSVTITAIDRTAATITGSFAHTHSNGAAITFPTSAFSYSTTDPASLNERLYAYASLMLGMNVNPMNVAYDSDTEATQDASGINMPIEAAFIPTQPIRSAPTTFNPSSPNTTGIYALEDTTRASGTTYACHNAGGASTGANCAFYQEFRRCYYLGSPIGQCATVVFPDAPNGGETAINDVMKMPTFTQTYTHTLAITGFDPVQGLADSGSLSLTGAAAPASGSNIVPGVAYILTP
jgi:hypothetical protein